MNKMEVNEVQCRCLCFCTMNSWMACGRYQMNT